jgi:hypothetical protein
LWEPIRKSYTVIRTPKPPPWSPNMGPVNEQNTAERLHRGLDSVFGSAPTREALEGLVGAFQRMASVYLARKKRRGRLDPLAERCGLDDLALDCVADLFARDERNRFVTLEAYYKRAGWPDLSPEDTLQATRRLVWSAVDQALFRRMHQVSPALSKLIRALKRASREHDDLCLVHIAGVKWIALAEEETEPLGRGPGGLPVMPPVFLGARLAERLQPLSSPTSYEAVEALRKCLSDQRLYAGRYPVTALAKLLLEVAVTREGALGEPEVDVHRAGQPGVLTPREVVERVERAVVAVRERMEPSYVAKGKVDGALFEHYLAAVQAVLLAEYAPHVLADAEQGAPGSLADALERHVPGIERETYLRHHRVRVEYICRCVRQHFFSSVRGAVQAG